TGLRGAQVRQHHPASRISGNGGGIGGREHRARKLESAAVLVTCPRRQALLEAGEAAHERQEPLETVPARDLEDDRPGEQANVVRPHGGLPGAILLETTGHIIERRFHTGSKRVQQRRALEYRNYGLDLERPVLRRERVERGIDDAAATLEVGGRVLRRREDAVVVVRGVRLEEAPRIARSVVLGVQPD